MHRHTQTQTRKSHVLFQCRLVFFSGPIYSTDLGPGVDQGAGNPWEATSRNALALAEAHPS